MVCQPIFPLEWPARFSRAILKDKPGPQPNVFEFPAHVAPEVQGVIMALSKAGVTSLAI